MIFYLKKFIKTQRERKSKQANDELADERV